MKKTIEKVWIEPGCISCGSCAFLAPEVFEVVVTSQIKPNAPVQEQSEHITLAARSCPVSVIKYTSQTLTNSE